jgi:hypothetical protein
MSALLMVLGLPSAARVPDSGAEPISARLRCGQQQQQQVGDDARSVYLSWMLVAVPS